MKKYRRKKKFNNKYIFVLLVILLMSIGYASVSTTLKFNGISMISVNISELDCYIGNVFINSINKFSTLSNDLTSFNFSIDSSTEIEYYIVNNTTDYDIVPKIMCSDSTGKDVSFSNDYPTVILPQKVEVGTIKIETTEKVNIEYTCLLTYERLEREESIPKIKRVFYSADGAKIDHAYKEYTTETTYESLDIPTKENSIFLSWMNSNKELISEEKFITDDDDEVIFANWSILHAKYTKYDPKSSSSKCTTVQCAIDELAGLM